MRFVPLLLVVCTVATTAVAQSVDPYKTGVKLENAGSIVDALAAFESIPPEKRDYNTKLHIASCKRKLGRLLEAERDYEAIRADPKADQPTVETAASDLEDLRAKLPKLRVTVTVATTSATVVMDGKEITVPATVPVNPGTHTIVATRAAKEVYRREFNITEGTTLDVEIDAPAAAAPALRPAPGAADRPVAPSATPDMTPERTPVARTLGLVLGGIGVVAIGGGIGFAARAESFESDAKAAAARGDHNAGDLVDGARGAQLTARIALGVGAVCVLGGGVLVVSSFGRDTRQPAAATLKIAPTVGTSWGLLLRGDF